jgi:Domain of unknown function (DUF5666)
MRVAFLSLLTIFISACGSSGSSTTTSSGTTSATPTATCPPNRFKTTTGTVQSVTGTSFMLSTQGSSIQANYATTTRIQREAAITSSALKEGTGVTVAVKQDTSGNYTATRITLVPSRSSGSGSATGGFGGSSRSRNANCFRQNAALGGGFGGGTGAASSANTLTGTTGQLSGNTLTITDSQGSNYTVTLNASTQIIQFQSTTASALKNGANITLTGSANSQGVITTQSITILLPTSNTASSSTA